jgi:hypothetical protein
MYTVRKVKQSQFITFRKKNIIFILLRFQVGFIKTIFINLYILYFNCLQLSLK